MNKYIIVYCKDCIHGDFLQKRLESYFGCNTALCNECPCEGCYCCSPTFGIKFEDRPFFVLNINN